MQDDRVSLEEMTEKPVIKAPLKPIDQYVTQLSAGFDPAEVGSDEQLEFVREDVNINVLKQLRSGQRPIQASIDLHGMTASEACISFENFLRDCQQYHIYQVRVVHGKGWSSSGNKPVLKSLVNAWLQQLEMVQAFCSAPERDGGTGAVYILLS